METYFYRNINTSNGRDFGLDILRSLGLLCIILAHCGASNIVMQLRAFDVPLMVLVSGASFAFSGAYISYSSYIKKRLIRLIAPVWFFLIFFFVVNFFLSKITSDIYPYDYATIAETFLLGEGIGYLWIIRVFILVALIAPFALRLSNRIESNTVFFCYILSFYLIYEVIYHIYNSTYQGNFIVKYYLFYLIPYSCIFAIGLRLNRINYQRLFINSLILLILLVVTMYWNAINDATFSINNFKYPPRMYYVWYGLIVSFLLYLFVKNRAISRINNMIIVFISSSTMWIYLWHILIIKIVDDYPSIFRLFKDGYFEKWIFVAVLSTVITYLQKALIANLMRKNCISVRHARMVSFIFLR